MARRSSERPLPITTYAILGLVSFQETSGYDLKRFADMSIHYFFWSPARSQVYAELRRLTALGYVTEREVEQERRPDKRLYRITPEGDKALRQWLEGPVMAADMFKSPFLLRLFFGRFDLAETLIAQLEERRHMAQETLTQYEEIERHIKGSEQFFFSYLTLKSGIANCHAALQWTEDAIQQLKDKLPAESPTE